MTGASSRPAFNDPAGPSTSPYRRRAVRLRDTQGRGAGSITLGSFLRSFTRGNVWLAEAMTGHLAMRGMTGRAGQRLVPRKTMTGGSVRFPGQDR
jgi:hypothetical protein